MKKTTLNSKMKKFESELIRVEDVRDIEKIENIIIDIFPDAVEIHVESKDDLFFYVGEEYEGAKPSKKELLKIDSNFKSINKIYGLDVGTTKNEKGQLVLYSSTEIEYFNKYNHIDNTCYTIIEKVIS